MAKIATRLGNNRSESDIIVQVVALLDGINEETVFNKLNNAWEQTQQCVGSHNNIKEGKE